VDTDECPVDPDLLRGDREVDRLGKRVAAGVSQPAAGVPDAERQEADSLRVCQFDSNVVDGHEHSRQRRRSR